MPNLSLFEKFCFRPYGREVWKARLYPFAFIVRVAEAPADHESTNEDVYGCSRDNKPVFIEAINK